MSKLDTMEELLREIRSLRKSIAKLETLNKRLGVDRPRTLYAVQFVAGVFRGIGSFLGATLVAGLMLYALAQLPFVQRYIDYVQSLVEQVQ